MRDAFGEIIRLAREDDFKGCRDAVHRVEDEACPRAFDVMTVVPEGGEYEEVRYFDITRQMAYGMKFLDEASD